MCRTYVPGKRGAPRADVNEQAFVDEMHQRLYGLTATLDSVRRRSEAALAEARTPAALGASRPYLTQPLRDAVNATLGDQLGLYTAIMGRWARAAA